LNQQNPKGATTTQDFSFLSEASPIYVTSLSNNNSTVTSAAVTQARINAIPPAKSPTVKSFSNPIVDQFGNNSATYIHHPELHQTNSSSNQVLTTSIIRKPITSSSTFDNKSLTSSSNIPSTIQHQISGGTQIVTQQQQQLTAIPLYDPSSDLIKTIASNNVVNNNSINFHNNINVLNNINATGVTGGGNNNNIHQLSNNLDFDSNAETIGCTSYYSNNRTNEVR
jgi:hypothetical protein